MSDSEYEAMIHDTLHPDEYMRIRWDLPTMPSFADGDMCTTRAVVAIGVSDAPIYLDLTGIAKLRAVLDEAEAAFHRRSVKVSQPVVVRTREEVEVFAGKGNEFVAIAADMGAFNMPKVDVIQAPQGFGVFAEVEAQANDAIRKMILGESLTMAPGFSANLLPKADEPIDPEELAAAERLVREGYVFCEHGQTNIYNPRDPMAERYRLTEHQTRVFYAALVKVWREEQDGES